MTLQMRNQYSRIIFFCALAMLLPQSLYAQKCSPEITRTASDDRYDILGDGSEVLDKKTNLIWLRCSSGQVWSNGSCIGEPQRYIWTQALKVAHDVGNGYRLPNIKELISLTEEACEDPTMNISIFPNTPSWFFWSSTPISSKYSSNGAYSYDSWTGSIGYGSSGSNSQYGAYSNWEKSYSNFVRAVRNK